MAIKWAVLAPSLAAVSLATSAYAANASPNDARQPLSEVTIGQHQLATADCQIGLPDGGGTSANVKSHPACLELKPALRIETGMHVGPIWNIAADARCRLLVTASSDQTVRLWAMPEARLIRTQYLPANPLHDGNTWVMSLSPDAKFIATGGRGSTTADTYHVILFDTATGTHIRRVGSFEGRIRGLAFSADGQRIAVALASGHGIRVLDVTSGRELMADRSFDGRDVYSVTFAPNGALYAAGGDSFLHHYTPLLEPAGRIATMGGMLPKSLSIDLAGRRVAVGYADTSAIEIYDADDLHRLVVANTKARGNGSFPNVAWSSDGERLYAAGTFKDGIYRRRIFTFSPEGHRLGPDWPVGTDTITSLTPCDDSMAFGTSSATFGVLPPDDPPRILARSHTIDMRAKRGDRFTVSADGSQLRFDLELDVYSPVLFDLTRTTFADSPSRPPDHVEPDTVGLPVTSWQDAAETRLSGKPFPLGYKGGRSYALAVRPDRAGFVLGSSSALAAYDAAGAQRWIVWGPGATFGVNLARDGNLVIAAYDDGTFRWYRWSDGRELLALFINKDTRAWVAWTPYGYFTASPGDEGLIGWQIGYGLEQPISFLPASSFRAQYERPDIIQLVLITLDEQEAIKKANAARH